MDPEPLIRTMDFWSGSNSGSCSFRHRLSRCQENARFFLFLLISYCRV